MNENQTNPSEVEVTGDVVADAVAPIITEETAVVAEVSETAVSEEVLDITPTVEVAEVAPAVVEEVVA
jgi:hypothetical protein